MAAMDYRLEVIGVPVSDVDAAKDFYAAKVGFHLDHDVEPSPEMRVVQLTPPGSPCSIVIGRGMPLGEPGTTKGLQLVVDDIDTARADLAARGVAITDVQQLGPPGTPGSRFAFFADPDGNGWAVQELKRG
jgi:catechol 2,3-dioxygenase-like lactoylglutathione lyase family enzyme